jgi:hypothetical protein
MKGATIKKTYNYRKLAGGGNIPYIDPRQFTYHDPNLDTMPPRPVDFSVASDPKFAMATVPNWKGPGISMDAIKAPAGSNASGDLLGKAADYAKSIAPFASNIVNAFRTVPKPAQPIMDDAPVFQKVDMSADRDAVSREVNAASTAADRALDGNTAEKVRQFNLGTKLNQFSSINQQERNTNVGIANQQATATAAVNARNNSKQEGYRNDLKEGQVAQQREQSQNFANAADKFIAIGNEKSKEKLDLQKATIMRSLYDRSGVLKRQGAQWKADGTPDPFGQDYKWLNNAYIGLPSPSGSIKKFGGSIKLK